MKRFLKNLLLTGSMLVTSASALFAQQKSGVVVPETKQVNKITRDTVTADGRRGKVHEWDNRSYQVKHGTTQVREGGLTQLQLYNKEWADLKAKNHWTDAQVKEEKKKREAKIAHDKEVAAKKGKTLTFAKDPGKLVTKPVTSLDSADQHQIQVDLGPVVPIQKLEIIPGNIPKDTPVLTIKPAPVDTPKKDCPPCPPQHNNPAIISVSGSYVLESPSNNGGPYMYNNNREGQRAEVDVKFGTTGIARWFSVVTEAAQFKSAADTVLYLNAVVNKEDDRVLLSRKNADGAPWYVQSGFYFGPSVHTKGVEASLRVGGGVRYNGGDNTYGDLENRDIRLPQAYERWEAFAAAKAEVNLYPAQWTHTNSGFLKGLGLTFGANVTMTEKHNQSLMVPNAYSPQMDAQGNELPWNYQNGNRSNQTLNVYGGLKWTFPTKKHVPAPAGQ